MTEMETQVAQRQTIVNLQSLVDREALNQILQG
jgi:hypothetical protein